MSNTYYYVKKSLGAQSPGDVIYFSPGQIGEGVDVEALLDAGVLRAVTGDEADRGVEAKVPEQNRFPQTFTTDSTPTNGTSGTFAGSANTGSMLTNLVTGATYVNTGSIASPTWTGVVKVGDGLDLADDGTISNAGAAGTLAALTDVDISEAADQQVLAWNDSAGKVEPLAGVTGGAAEGFVVAGPITVNSPTAPAESTFSTINGSLSINESTGSSTDEDTLLFLNQGQPLTGDQGASSAFIVRQGALNGHDYTGPMLTIEDETASTAPLLDLNGLVGMVVRNLFRFSKAGGLSQGDGTATATHSIKMGDGQTALPFSITDHADAPKASIAADGEIVTVDDVLAPFGTVKGAVLAFAPTVGTGAPSTGAHNAGEMIMDSAGALFVCTANGTPGTWKSVTLT